MSTNYYWNPSPSSELACYGQLRIGRSSGGWSFSFQAYDFAGRPADKHSLEVANALSVLVDVPALPALKLKCFEDWKALIEQPGSSVQDEYSRAIPVEDFLTIVQVELHPVTGTWTAGGRKIPLLNPYDEIAKNSHRFGGMDPEREWKDSHGYSFCF